MGDKGCTIEVSYLKKRTFYSRQHIQEATPAANASDFQGARMMEELGVN
jgi:hypothetical protein